MLPGGPFNVRHAKSRRARRQPNFSFAIEEPRPGAIQIVALQAGRAAGSYEELARDVLESSVTEGCWTARQDVELECKRAAPDASAASVEKGVSRAAASLIAAGSIEKNTSGRKVYFRRLIIADKAD